MTAPAIAWRLWHWNEWSNDLLYAALAEEACVKAGVQLRYYESPLSVTATADGWRARSTRAAVRMQ